MAKLVPAEDAGAATKALEPFLDPIARATLSTDYDDEPVTDDDLAALELARVEHRRGETTPHDEILREFDLK